MITEEFKKEFAKFVKKFENEKLKIYDCGDGVPTIGVGFALINKVNDRWQACDKKLLKDKGINLTNDQYKIIQNYAKAKSEGLSTLHLKKQLEALDFTIDVKISQSLLEYSVEQKYKELKNQIGGEEHWDKLNLAQQIGVMDYSFQMGNVLPLKESLVAGNYDKTAKIMREMPNNSKAIKDRAELRSDFVKYGTMEFSGIHIIQPNDVASSIAEHHNITLKQLAELNPHLKNLNKLSVGQKINIAPPVEKDAAGAIATSSNNGENISINEFYSNYVVERFRQMSINTPTLKLSLDKDFLEVMRSKNEESYKAETERLMKMVTGQKLPTREEWSFIVYRLDPIPEISQSEITRRTEVVELLRVALLAQKEAAYKQETERLAKILSEKITPDFISQWNETRLHIHIESEDDSVFSGSNRGISEAEVTKRMVVEEAINKTIGISKGHYGSSNAYDFSKVLLKNFDDIELWNRTESSETRENAETARKLTIALPKELTQQQNTELTEHFASECLVSHGMIADINIHYDNPNNPHVHIQMTTRKLLRLENGEVIFGEKGRDWGRRNFYIIIEKM